ncbi:hypothetical protein LX36DRAFT_384076 [Colletotrichum falcatum]|nr:hypothetical protein LX36DRAFT_384076 [Colletotrichum falcatum]
MAWPARIHRLEAATESFTLSRPGRAVTAAHRANEGHDGQKTDQISRRMLQDSTAARRSAATDCSGGGILSSTFGSSNRRRTKALTAASFAEQEFDSSVWLPRHVLYAILVQHANFSAFHRGASRWNPWYHDNWYSRPCAPTSRCFTQAHVVESRGTRTTGGRPLAPLSDEARER